MSSRESSPEPARSPESSRESSRESSPAPPPKKVRKPGILHFTSLPIGMHQEVLRRFVEQHAGEVLHMHLNCKSEGVKRTKEGFIKGCPEFTEGWVQVASKRHAKGFALHFNGSQVGGSRKSPFHDQIWCVKYRGKGLTWRQCRPFFTNKLNAKADRIRLNIETKKISLEADEHIKQSEIAERQEKRGKIADAASQARAQNFQGRIKQRLTEEQIQEQKNKKAKKDAKFKARIQKAKKSKRSKSGGEAANVERKSIFG